MKGHEFNDLAKRVWNMGSTMARAQAEMGLRSDLHNIPIRLVYLLWNGDVLLGICGTENRATQEADAIGRVLQKEIRIETREVHS